jgi:hypothetical protein
MDFTLAFTRSLEQIIVREFSEDNSGKSKIVNLEDVKDYAVDGLIAVEQFAQGLENDLKFYPIRSAVEFNLSAESFEKMDYASAKNIFDKMRENWILQNNLTLIEELFKTRQHLISLWPNDRSGFFEELWFILRSNLGAKNLVFIYNDIIKSKNEHEKNKLIKVKVRGNRFPELTTVDEMDEMVLKNYEKNFGNIFDITDYNKEKGQLVICASVKKSPILMMANISQLTRMQKAVLSSLFEGLNLSWPPKNSCIG